MSDVDREILAAIEDLKAFLARVQASYATGLAGPAVHVAEEPALDGLYELIVEIERKVHARAERQASQRGGLFEEMAGLLPEAVFRTDADLRFVYANPVALEMIGISPSDFGLGFNLLDYVDEVDRARVVQMVGQLGLGRQFSPTVFKARRADGRTAWRWCGRW